MKMKKWFKCLLMTMALMMVVGTGTVGTTIPAAAKAKTETVEVGKKFQKGKFQYKVTSLKGKTGTAALISVKSKKMTSVTVPDTVKLKGYTLTVTEIGANAFKNCKKLKSVTTNTKIKKIGKNAFAGCKKLGAMNIKSTELSSVGKNALKGIPKSAVVTAPAGTSYGQLLKVPVKTPAPTVRQTEKETEKVLQTETSATALKAEPGTAAQTQTKPETKAETQTEVETEAETQTEVETEAETQTEVETEAETQTEVETEAETQTEVETEVETQTEVETEVETETEAAVETETKAETDAVVETETEVETEAVVETETEVETEAVVETETEAETEAAVETETEVETKIETEAETQTEVETEVETEAVAEPETEAETEAVVETETEVETEAVVETETEAETEAIVETETKAETEAVVETETEAETEAIVETETEPITEVEAKAETEAEAQTEAVTEEQKAPASKPKAKAPAPKKETCDEKHLGLVEVASVAPTCTETGLSAYEYCTVCGYKTEPIVLTALGHSYGEWTVAQAATCTETGTEERCCTICGAKETKAIAATGHTLGEPEIVPISGSNCYGREVRECISCDYVEKSSYPMHRKDVMVQQEDIPATCTTSGKTNRWYCPYCKLENFSYVKPLGHEYSAEWTYEEGTCVKAGIRYHKCVHDGCTAKANVQETVKAEGHQWVDASVEATCTEAGFDGQKCALCGELNGKEIQPLGHEYETTIVKASCEETGTKKDTCIRCGKTEMTVLPASGQHQWVEHPEVAATCSTAGQSAYTQCALCGEYKDGAKPKTLAATGEHKWILTSRTPYTAMGINAANGGDENDGKRELTTFGTEVCQQCGIYNLIPGKGLSDGDISHLLGLADDKMSGYIQWAVFISEEGWNTSAGNPQPLSQLYCHDFCLNHKKYAGYIPALRSSKTLSLTPLTPVVPAGKIFKGWQQVGSDGRPMDGIRESNSFNYEDTGKTFIAVFQ